jgi:hypothetical protein
VSVGAEGIEMKVSVLCYSTLMSAAVAMLAACGGSQQPTIVQGGPSQNRAVANRGISNEDLLYVSGGRLMNRVFVFTYPSGRHVITLTKPNGLLRPSAVCADASQNVWISRVDPSEMIEFAHGGTTPLATLPDNYGSAASCSVDPKTGNLAVANLFGANGYGSNMIVYATAQGTPSVYSIPKFEYVWGCAYDASGDLFASGEVYNSGAAVAELPAGGSEFKDLKVSRSLENTATGLQWDGTYLDLGVDTQIYRLLISGSRATVKKRITLLDADREWAFYFFVDGGTVISHVEPSLGAVGLWSLPSGGAPTQIIPNAPGEKNGFDEDGITVSKAVER